MSKNTRGRGTVKEQAIITSFFLFSIKKKSTFCNSKTVAWQEAKLHSNFSFLVAQLFMITLWKDSKPVLFFLSDLRKVFNKKIPSEALKNGTISGVSIFHFYLFFLFFIWYKEENKRRRKMKHPTTHVTCHVSNVIFHILIATCHMSCVTCLVSYVKSLWLEVQTRPR